ncbi:MAG TPA: hypothetical protein DCE23_04005 [Firmicutes bacterium]|nr:hypothetical protein [Bacillota bacterium]
MDICLAILLLTYVITMILEVITTKKQQKLIREILDFNLKLVAERGKIVQIIIDSKINSEDYLTTLEKIEKILKGEDE